MRLRYTLQGATELDEILSLIKARSPTGARRIHGRIQAVVDLLLRYPNAGSLVGKAGLRRLTVLPYPYLIFYQITGEDIVIHGVRHGARHPSSMPDA